MIVDSLERIEGFHAQWPFAARYARVNRAGQADGRIARAAVAVIAKPAAEGARQALVLTEDRLGHYPEFRDFFVRTFGLDRVGLSEPGFIRAPSEITYTLVFVVEAASPSRRARGVRDCRSVGALGRDTAVDKDLWAILGWMVSGAGAPWTVEDLHATGRLYRIPAAG
jgi:hypothetical protein